MDEAEKELMLVLNLLWDDLESCGVACDAIEIECIHFGRAEWAEYLHRQHDAGAA